MDNPTPDRPSASLGWARATLAALLILALPACELDTSVLRDAPTPAIWAVPSLLCPGEQTTVSWDIGGNFDDCTNPAAVVGSGLFGHTTFCKSVILTNDAGLLHDVAVDRTENVGSRAYTLARTTTFTVEGSLRETDWTIEDTAVATVVETGGAAQRFTFTGGCSGATAAWGGVELRGRLSSCVGITSVCNVSRHVLDIRSEDGRFAVVDQGACVPEFNGAATNLTARPVDFTVTPDLCGSTVTSGGPPDLEIEVQVECNLDLPDCPAP